MSLRRNHRVERARQEKARLEARPDDKPIRPYRSEAERVALTQRNIQIGLSIVILIVGLTNLLVQAF